MMLTDLNWKPSKVGARRINSVNAAVDVPRISDGTVLNHRNSQTAKHEFRAVAWIRGGVESRSGALDVQTVVSDV